MSDELTIASLGDQLQQAVQAMHDAGDLPTFEGDVEIHDRFSDAYYAVPTDDPDCPASVMIEAAMLTAVEVRFNHNPSLSVDELNTFIGRIAEHAEGFHQKTLITAPSDMRPGVRRVSLTYSKRIHQPEELTDV